jgi:hypothetical protein
MLKPMGGMGDMLDILPATLFLVLGLRNFLMHEQEGSH